MVAEMIYNCSTVCDCYFLPKINVITINCSKRKLTKSPENFEIIKNTSSTIDFILKHNFIEVQPNLRSQNISTLDISNNYITTLDVNLFPKDLKVSNKNNIINNSINYGLCQKIRYYIDYKIQSILLIVLINKCLCPIVI